MNRFISSALVLTVVCLAARVTLVSCKAASHSSSLADEPSAASDTAKTYNFCGLDYGRSLYGDFLSLSQARVIKNRYTRPYSDLSDVLSEHWNAECRKARNKDEGQELVNKMAGVCAEAVKADDLSYLVKDVWFEYRRAEKVKEIRTEMQMVCDRNAARLKKWLATEKIEFSEP